MEKGFPRLCLSTRDECHFALIFVAAAAVVVVVAAAVVFSPRRFVGLELVTSDAESPLLKQCAMDFKYVLVYSGCVLLQHSCES